MEILDPQGENVFSLMAFYVTGPKTQTNCRLLFIVLLIVVLLAKFPYYIQFIFKVHQEKSYRLGSWSLRTIRA